MKILIGVCGIGNGHCIRQYELCKALLKREHEIRILTYGKGVTFFKNTDIKVYDVYVPMITFKGEKINIYDFVKRNILKIVPGTLKNKIVYKQLKKENFVPDLCISDYEPTVAKIAYKLKKTLINIDQHSKFIYMNDIVNGFSNVEEKKRLNLFFPNSEKMFSVSFYNLPKILLPSNVKILYPIIRDDLKQALNFKHIQKKQIIVYFSKYIDIPIEQSIEEVIEIFNSFDKYNFIIFSTEYANSGIETGKNVIIVKNDRENFIKELVNSIAVITTAGHTLISEALYCNLPLFVIPLPTFDQNYCGKFINDNNIGKSSYIINKDNLNEFLSNLNIYKENIKRCPNLVKPMDTLSYLISQIENYEKK